LSNQPILKITDLQQVGIVVRDLDRAMRGLWETFGIGPWNVVINGPERLYDTRYLGKPGRFGYKVAKHQNKLGSGFEIELIEPLGGPSIYTDFLDRYGEGVQHIGRQLAASRDEFNTMVRKLESGGFPCTMSGRNAFCSFAYFDAASVLHTVLEVIWIDPEGKSVPDRVFPD